MNLAARALASADAAVFSATLWSSAIQNLASGGLTFRIRFTIHTESSVGFVPWKMLSGVRNNSLKKAARYRGEKSRPDLPKREELEATSRRFAVKSPLADTGGSNDVTARFAREANALRLLEHPNLVAAQLKV